MVAREELEFDHLGPEAAKAFCRHGVVCLRGVLDRQWVELLREGVDVAIAAPRRAADQRRKNGFFSETEMWRHRVQFRRFALESPIGALGGMIMGAREARLYNDTVFVKEPRTIEPTPWHHDLPYFNLEGMQTCSSWIGLDRVTSASGAMSFVPGSHLWGKLYQPIKLGLDDGPQPGAEEYDGRPPNIDADLQRYHVVSFDLEPSDVTFHNLLTLHKAGANTTSDVRRRAHTMRMVGDDVVWADRPFSTARFDTKLEPGAKLEGRDFPVLWSRDAS